MMNRIDAKFRELERLNDKALIIYLMAGDPDLASTERLVLELDRRGVDMVELGVPFSDPIADGPTIQAASQRALKKGASLGAILRLVERIRRKSDMPIALMTYYNPVFCYGAAGLIDRAARSGVDGIMIPDLPPEEAGDLIDASLKRDFKTIFFLSPTSPAARVKMIARESTGFIYYVSLTGVTGARRRLPREIARDVGAIKSVTDKPVAVGFGISTPAQAAAIAKAADGVIVGSAVVSLIEKNAASGSLIEKVGNFATKMLKMVKGV